MSTTSTSCGRRPETRYRPTCGRSGIGALIHYPVPVHLQPAYAGRLPGADALPETEAAARQVLSLPMFPELSDEQVRDNRRCDSRLGSRRSVILRKHPMPKQPVPWRRLLTERWLYILVILSAICTTLAYQRSTPFHLDLTSTLHGAALEGFFAPGDTPSGPVRWTTGRADVRLQNLWPGQPVRLSLVLSAPRGDEPDPAKRDLPVEAQIAVNGRPLATVIVPPGPTGFDFDVPAEVIGPSGSLFVTLRAPIFVPPADLRPLALLVGGDRVRRPSASRPTSPHR